MHSLLLQVSAAVQIARQQGASPLVRRLEPFRHVDRYVKRASLLLDVGRMNGHAPAPAGDRSTSSRWCTNSGVVRPEAAFNRSSLNPLCQPVRPMGPARTRADRLQPDLECHQVWRRRVHRRDVESKQDSSVQFEVRDRGIELRMRTRSAFSDGFERLSTSRDIRRAQE